MTVTNTPIPTDEQPSANLIELDRRSFLVGTYSFAVAACVSNGQIALAEEVPKWLTEHIAPSADLLLPDQIGQIGSSELEQFARYSEFLTSAWGLTPYFDTDISSLKEDVKELIDVKASEPPSYFTEYGHASKTIMLAIEMLSSEEKAFELLSFGSIADPTPELSRLGRFRKYVFSELARYLIATGGFRRFKPSGDNLPAKNYLGYIGGPFSDPSYLPYRGIKS